MSEENVKSVEQNVFWKFFGMGALGWLKIVPA